MRPFQTPNKQKGRRGYDPRAVVIHVTEGSTDSALAWIKEPEAQVSYHYLVTPTGIIYNMVPAGSTAWHAGIVEKPTWERLPPDTNPNLYTLGVAYAGFGDVGPSFTQLCEMAKLVGKLCKDNAIPIDKDWVIPHNSINGAKSCPGDRFDMDAFRYLCSVSLSS